MTNTLSRVRSRGPEEALWRRIAIAIVFLAGLAIGYYARGAIGTLQHKDTHSADLAGIERLHQDDIKATLSQDPQGLPDIWDENGVRPNLGSLPTVGKQAIANQNAKFHADYPGFKVLSYAAKYRNIQIEDGLACEWGEHESQFKLSPEAQPTNWHGEGFHVLERQSDGSWKFVMMILNQ